MKKYLTWVICLPLLISCSHPTNKAMEHISEIEKSDCTDKINALEMQILTLKTQVRIYEIADSVYFARKK